MAKQLTREEVSDEYKWDLTPIYKDVDEFNKHFLKTEKLVLEVSDYKGKIITSSDNILKYLEYDMNVSRQLSRLYYYAHLNSDADTQDILYQELSGRVTNLFTKYDELSAFVGPEFLTINVETMKDYIKENEKLKAHEFNLLNIYRYVDHTLSESEEELLTNFTQTAGSASEIYDALTNTDIKFPNITDEKGNEVELTESNYSVYLRSKNRSVRESAFKSLLTTYNKYKTTLSSTLKGQIEALCTTAKVRKYKSSLEASLYSDEVPVDVYNNLIKTVNENLDIIHDYYKTKKECLNLPEMHIYDLYVDLVDEIDKTYSVEEAKKLILEACAPLGEDYIEILNKAFDEKWIDFYNNKSKRTGAYSSGFYDTNPYILLNFESKFDDVSTMAHELGHSLHSYYSKEQEYQNSSYTIFVAEVASLTNELLLYYSILNKTKDKKEKKYVLNYLMELYKSTIYRQVMFAEFERDIHKDKENGEILTSQFLSDKYYKLNKKYYGENVLVDDELKNEWMRIPHFYYDFYMYKYAVGLACASDIVKRILENKENSLEDYKNFLKSGGSDSPINLLKKAGIDVTNQDYVKSALDMFKDLIEQFKNL
ncbi:MAG: oligoendopeptidase F [Mycoplasmatota bacterium]